MFKRLICRLFGHTRYSGWYGDGLYGDLIENGIDGIGRKHFAVKLECDRCGKPYIAAKFSRKVED